MRRYLWILVGSCLSLTIAVADAGAASVEGTVTYDGVLVMDAFDDITEFSAYVYDYDTFQRIPGSTDMATSTFEVTDLPVGHSLAVFAEIDRSSPANGSAFDPGDLQSGTIVEITDPSQSATADIGVRMVMRFRTPFDSTVQVQANANTCPIGFETSSPVELSWDEVAGAVSYEVQVLHRTCDHVTVSADRYSTTGTTVEFAIGSPNEDFYLIQLQCPGTVASNLCFIPFVPYLDTTAQAILIRFGDGSPAGRGSHHDDAFFLPAVASAPGVAPTYWTSAVTVTNLADSDSTVRVFFTPSGVDGMLEYSETELVLPARSSLMWDNVVLSLFGSDGVGSLEIRGAGLAIASRTSTPAEEEGSYGQGIPSVGPDQIISVAGSPTATLGSVTENAEFRSNLGLCETWGENATVEVRVSDESGQLFGSRTISLRPYENLQINRLVRNVTSLSNLENGIVTVTVVGGGGRVAAYLSTVDNATGDPTYLIVAPSRPTGG